MIFANGWGIIQIMEYVSLYRRFRPDSFDKVIGQNHIVRTLTNQIKNDRVGHAYLFTGTRGTGKTSCAKIFARAVNCLNPQNGSPCGVCEVCRELKKPANIDVIEIDAASNNGVDEIRELKENAQYRPVVGKYKVYIIDEVHMLSAAAFNALLKTLEEPPEHVIFILATTEVQKLPQTILSRCMRFDFRLVERDELVGLLKRIFAEMGVPVDERALSVIAAGGEGSVRDALSLADMCLSYGGDKITYEDALDVTCATNFVTLDELAGAILDGDCGKALRLTGNLLSSGRNTLSRDLATYFINMLNIKNVPGLIPDGLTPNDAELILKRIDGYSNYRIARIADLMCALESEMRYSTQPKIVMETAVVRACELVTDATNEGLAERIRTLEKKLADIEKNGVVFAEEAPVVEKKTEPTEKKTDVNEILSNIAEKEVEIVFTDDMPGADSDAYKANAIWAEVSTRLNDSDKFMLKMAVQGTENTDCVIQDKKFIVRTPDAAMSEILNQNENKQYMQTLINEVSGEKYEFLCVRNTSDKNEVSASDRLTLDRLFNGEIKILPKK
ncbi:MAG: DNA polymerase III subunit gamma/tau [Christensenellales bacterium]